SQSPRVALGPRSPHPWVAAKPTRTAVAPAIRRWNLIEAAAPCNRESRPKALCTWFSKMMLQNWHVFGVRPNASYPAQRLDFGLVARTVFGHETVRRYGKKASNSACVRQLTSNKR